MKLNITPFLITLFDYPDDIRKVIYTTNVIESLNSVIRKAVKKRRTSPFYDRVPCANAGDFVTGRFYRII